MILALKGKLNELKERQREFNVNMVKYGKERLERSARSSKKKDWSWKKVPPKDGERKMKTVSIKTYHWCHNQRK